MNVRAQGEGFFARIDTRPYHPRGAVVGQVYHDSCVAACCRMLLRDQGRIVGETMIRAALMADDKGAYLSAAVTALSRLGAEVSYVYCPELDVPGLRAAVGRGPAIVFLKDDPQDDVGHVVIVDEFKDDYVCIRDPWPLASGAAYAVSLAGFERVWLMDAGDNVKIGHAVTLK